MLRLALLVCLVAAAAAVPVESDTEFCNGEKECPQDCGYVSRNDKCVFCRCGDSPLIFPTPEKRPEPEVTCEYGPSFIDECDNDCKCIQDGKYGCSRKACKPGQTAEKPKSCIKVEDLPRRDGQRVVCHEGIVKVQPLDEKCLPGSKFLDSEYCNTCTCSDTGAEACTLKACIEDEPVCEHGPAIIDECDNDCKCIKGGRYGCTRKLCKPGQTPMNPKSCSKVEDLPRRDGQRVVCHEGIVKVQPLDAKCLPGATFLDSEYCNTCTCSDSGAEACTLKACVKSGSSSSSSGCPHGAAFIDECNNDCACVNDAFYGCTFKACKQGERPEVPMKCSSSDNLPARSGADVVCEDGIVKLIHKKCEHGEEYIDECGSECRCLGEEGYACVHGNCKEGQVSMVPMSCNRAADLPSHRGNKRVFCHEGIVKMQDKDEKCLPGAVFPAPGNECNDCTCTDTGVPGCTLKLCVGEPSESTVTCEDGLPECPQDCGQSYNQARDCFECPCSIGNPGDRIAQGGEECPPGSVVSESGPFFSTCEPSAKCPHGFHYIDECDNDCACGADGYGCTLKACRPGQSAEKPMKCEGSADLPKREGLRVICHEGIVKVQEDEDSCLPGGLFMEDCNSCFCGTHGQSGCTAKECPKKEGEEHGECKHGKAFIDQCDNDCECVNNAFYGCTYKACQDGQKSEEPMKCTGAEDLPERNSRRRVSCLNGIVRVQNKDEECLPGSIYKDECNTCTCGGPCTLKSCE